MITMKMNMKKNNSLISVKEEKISMTMNDNR